MPCYDPPTFEEKMKPRFIFAALCYCAEHMTEEQLAGFPGLREWKKRHDRIDSLVESGMDRWDAEREVRKDDPFGYDSGPRYLDLYHAHNSEDQS